MAKYVTTYLVDEIPDPHFSRYQLAAGGDVREVIWKGWETVVRGVSQVPENSIALSLLAIYIPSPSSGDVQSRLKFYLTAESDDIDYLKELSLLVEQGFLSGYYHFEPTENTIIEELKQAKACHIYRNYNLIKPLHPKQFNDRIPDWYYAINPFEPEQDNDYLALDKVLNTIQEPVAIILRIQPVDLLGEQAAHTKYLAGLQSINRSWDQDDFQYDWPSAHLVSKQDDSLFKSGPRDLKPLRKSDPLADTVLRSQQKIHESLSKPHLFFSFQVRAQSKAVAHLVATVVAESAFSSGSYKLGLASNESIPTEYKGLERLPSLATVEELSGAFRLPVASYGSPLCIRKNTDLPAHADQVDLKFGFDQELLPALTAMGGEASALGQSLIGIAKHAFICGVPGCGKTTEVMNLVLQLCGHGIPVLVIEPVKTEHRLMKTLKDSEDAQARRLAHAMEIYTPGNESISPFRYNCLESFPGIGVEEHIGNLLGCFMGAMPSTPFLPLILEESLERCYEDHDLIENPPLMEELLETVRQIIAEKGYSGETLSDIRAASELRLGSLTRGVMGKVFQCRRSVPSMDRLMSRPTLIELDHLAAEKAALLTLFLLMSLRERLLSIPKTGTGLRLVLVLEEAHNLVGRTGPAKSSEESADPKAFAAETICRMLVELRALEVGVIIVDQHPSAVAPEVVKATGTKLAFRQVDKDDREDLGASMLLGPLEIEEIARLRSGEAYFYTEGLHGPRRIQTPNLHERYDLSKDVIRGAILPYLENDPWLLEVGMERAVTELKQLKEAMDAYDLSWLRLVKRMTRLLQLNASASRQNDLDQASPTKTLRQQALVLKRDMQGLFSSLEKGPYRRLLLKAHHRGDLDPAVVSFRDALIERFEQTIKPGFKEAMILIDQLPAFNARAQGSG